MDRNTSEVDEDVQGAIDNLLNEVERHVTFNQFRVINCDMIDLSSDSDYSLTSSEDEDVCNQEDLEEKVLVMPVKAKGELDLQSLPPIENLSLKVQPTQLFHIGRISSIIDTLVVVQSFKNMPAIDLDSVLFLRDGLALGRIFDVFGQVIEPLYSVRFNSNEEIRERNIQIDSGVYIAPDLQAPITGYVFPEQLKRMKGSDASWEHDNEPPEYALDYSDDEEERTAKIKLKAKRTREHPTPHL